MQAHESELINVREPKAPHKVYVSNVSLSIYHHHCHKLHPFFHSFDRSRKSTRLYESVYVLSAREKKAIKFSTGFRGKKEPTNPWLDITFMNENFIFHWEQLFQMHRVSITFPVLICIYVENQVLLINKN